MGSAPELELVYRLKCSCNSYPWGKQGSDSLSARLCENQHGYGDDGPKSDFKIDSSKPYAEMWMGTYQVLPSYVASTGEDLQEVIDRHPKELLGEYTINKFGHSKLPYLPKVLSIAKALPLQLHPNKELASKLHREKPDDFTDPNHKPEIALPLSEFEAFCGFKELDSIAALMRLEPLKKFMPAGEGAGFTDKTLKAVVRKMLQADNHAVKDTYRALMDVPSKEYGGDADYILNLAPRLADQYAESDPGILVALITMNYLLLQPGECVYIPADGIHAYLSGDIIECMARSNNVLNTGFCPAAERSNIDMFCDCLTFTPHNREECLLLPQAYGEGSNGKTKLFAPPLAEFDMMETRLKSGEHEALAAAAGPSTVLATKGNGRMVATSIAHEIKESDVFFVAHGVELKFEAGSDGLLLHTVVVN